MLDMSGGRDYDQERLAELIVYIADRLIGDPRFGATMLNKVLFFADFEAYRRTGQSITGAVYQHLPQGPCAHQLLPAIQSLGSDVVWKETNTYAGKQKQLIALAQPGWSCSPAPRSPSSTRSPTSCGS
jgi:Protein of unknown function (DUF4065)